MTALLWLKGLLARRAVYLGGTVLGVALTVALLASLGAFIASSASSMTRRAIAGVPVDWQVQLSPGTSKQTVITAIGQSTAYTALEEVGYANVNGLTAYVDKTVQTTGAGKIVGVSPSYRLHFPTEMRLLIGSFDGVLVAQQTAANLHITPGDTVTIERPGLPAAKVKVAGIVDLPNADSFFQAIGVPANAAPQAPPDNVLLLPLGQWHQLFDSQAVVRPDSIRTQMHVRIAHTLPTNPNDAYLAVLQQANNLEARIAGSGIVGNNLAARLDGVRKDALYAQVLFLFLGLPGVVLAILLTFAVTASGATRRRQEQGLLRVRGSSPGQVLRFVTMEALVIGCGGVVLGLALAYLIATRIASLGTLITATTLLWVGIAALLGLVLAFAALLFPGWIQTRQLTVVAARLVVGRGHTPLWQRVYLDVIILALSALMYWRTASTGYQVVLAPEGVASASVAYETFLAPLCLWIGISLLTLRLWGIALRYGHRLFAKLLRPVAHGLSGAVASSLSRQRVMVTRGIVLVALAFSFAISTAVFNTTYNAQSQVDAQLTNGADVTVTGSTASPLNSKLTDLKALAGVASVQMMQHRFAYVGADLQDIFGIDAAHIGEATSLSNAFFGGGNARATLAALAARPDAILVSEETVMNFQLHVGDLLNLRIQSAQDHRYHIVPFHFVGIAREFPTAPKDSFLIVNSAYLAQQSATNAAEIALMRVNGNANDVATHARAVVKGLAGVRVTDIGSRQQTISSSLTAVDLRGLTTLELTFAMLFVAGATGLALALGLAERRRTFAILSALGARRNQLGAFLWSEGLLIQIGGGIVGIALGIGVAQMLVSVLTGVFDPAPEFLSVPWLYLLALVLAAGVSTVLAVRSAHVVAHRPMVESLREL
jgi:putative ABC transport system permease protein